MRVRVRIGDREYEADVEDLGGGKYRVSVGGQTIEVEVGGAMPVATVPTPSPAPAAKPSAAPVAAPAPRPAPAAAPQPVAGNIITAPISGKVLRILVNPGDEVEPATVVLTLESMKMELEVRAGRKGRIKEILVKPGDSVRTGQPIAALE